MPQEEVWICSNCEETINKNAKKCRHCGFNPSSHAAKAVTYNLIAIVFALSIVGIPVALLLQSAGKKHVKKSEMKVATRLA